MNNKRLNIRLKSFILIYLLILSFLAVNCQSGRINTKAPSSKKTWTYFKIYADADDHQVFVKVQDELGIDPKLERFTLVVNIKKDNPEPYIMFGDNEESNPKKFPWSRISAETQKSLIDWTGDNKEEL